MKIAIVGIQGLPNQYGGFETLSEFLVKYLGEKHEFTVYCSSVDQKGMPDEYLGAKLKYFDITSHGGKGILFDCKCLMDAVNGDYDYSMDNYESVMLKSGFKILNNSYDEILYKTSDPLYIVGLPSSIKENIKLDEAFEFYKDEDRRYVICLVHDGNTIKYLDDSIYEVDLILGGHSLNGSVVIPYYGPLFIDKNSGKYYQEEYSKGITKIYISSGIGTNKYNYRFNNKPSFNLYRLKAQS